MRTSEWGGLYHHPSPERDPSLAARRPYSFGRRPPQGPPPIMLIMFFSVCQGLPSERSIGSRPRERRISLLAFDWLFQYSRGCAIFFLKGCAAAPISTQAGLVTGEVEEGWQTL